MQQLNQANDPLEPFVILTDGGNRDLWLSLRHTEGIGASEGATVMGESPYTSPLELYLQKREPSAPGEDLDNQNFEWGHLLEPLILAKLGRKLNRVVSPSGALYQSKEWPWLLATIDGRVHPDNDRGRYDWIPVEAKATTSASMWENCVGPVPMHVWIQVQQQLAVTGKDYSFVPVLKAYHGWSWDYVKVRRDQKFILNQLVPKTMEFWDGVQHGVAPKVNGHPGTAKALSALHGYDAGRVMELHDDFITVVDGRNEAVRQVSYWEDQKAKYENVCRNELGDNWKGTMSDGSSVSWKQDKRGNRRLTFKRAPK